MFKNRLDSDIGMFVGLAIGDALGAPLEFQPARDPDNYLTNYMAGGAHNVSKGEFTDDTSMALAMADAFISSEVFDAKLIMQNFLRWKNEGAFHLVVKCLIVVILFCAPYEHLKKISKTLSKAQRISFQLAMAV